MTATIAAHGPGAVELAEQLSDGRPGMFTLARRCESLEEVMGACQAGVARVALFAGDDHALDATTVDRLRALGVVVVVLSHDAEEIGRLQRVGAVTLPADGGISQVEQALSSALDRPDPVVSQPRFDPDAGATGPRIRPGISWARVIPETAASEHPAMGGSADADHARSSGNARSTFRAGSTGRDAGPIPVKGGTMSRAGAAHAPRPGAAGERPAVDQAGPPCVLAVWGPAGAPGRTTVAVNLAAELALDGRKVALLDADVYGASVAAHLGLLDESAGLAQACRLADQGRLDVTALDRVRVPLALGGGSLDVLSGLTRPERWTELRGPALAIVLDLCAARYDHVIVDAGFCLEADEELSFDTMAPRRNVATLTALEAAEAVYAVGEATAVGLPRLVRSMPSLLEAAPQARVVVLMNKVRQDAVGRFPERQLREAWERFGPALPIGSFLPFSPDIADVALREGSVLAESAPHSTLRQAVRSVVCAPAQRSRKSSVFYTTTRRTRSR